MDIAKVVFEAIDKIFDKSQNRSVEIDGSDKITAIKDVRYSQTKKFHALLDVYYDAEIKEKKPVMFYIHGGGFVAGGKEYRTALSNWFAVQGYFVANVNYGLSPDCVFPEQIKHLFSALNWVKRVSKKYNLDLNKIVVSGDSAGAYFASMMACITESESLKKKIGVKTDMKFCATILNCGLYDMKSILKKRLALDLNSKIFESYTGIKKDEVEHYKYKDCCSPLQMIHKSFPPTLIIFAEKDVFCSGQAERLIKKFDDKNIYFESYKSSSLFANHCFSLEWKGKAAERANELQAMFLKKVKDGELPRHQSETTICIHESEDDGHDKV